MASISEDPPAPTNPAKSEPVGMRCCTAGSNLDIIDLLKGVLLTCGQCEAILDYRGNPDSTMSVRDVLEKLTDVPWCTEYFQLKITTPQGAGGDPQGRRIYGAFYLITHQTYKEMNDRFRGSFQTGVLELKTRKWYVKKYKDLGSVPKPIGILQGKNPNHGYAPDYEARIMDSLKGTIAEHFQINVVLHTDTTATGKRVKCWSIQVEESIAPEAEKAMRLVIEEKGSLNGLNPRFKTDKSNRLMYDQSLTNIVFLPSTFTGVPIISVSPEGAKHLRKELQTNPPQTSLPIDLEATHLTERLGKYMVTAPMSDYDAVKAHVVDCWIYITISINQNSSIHPPCYSPAGEHLPRNPRTTSPKMFMAICNH